MSPSLVSNTPLFGSGVVITTVVHSFGLLHRPADLSSGCQQGFPIPHSSPPVTRIYLNHVTPCCLTLELSWLYSTPTCTLPPSTSCSIFLVGMSLVLSGLNYRGLTVVGNAVITSTLAILVPFALLCLLCLPRIHVGQDREGGGGRQKMRRGRGGSGRLRCAC